MALKTEDTVQLSVIYSNNYAKFGMFSFPTC